MLSRIQKALAPHRKRLQKELKPQRLEAAQVKNLEKSLGNLVEQVIGEVLDARVSKDETETGPPPPSNVPVRVPYVGLAELSIGDGDIFFGNTKARDTLIERLDADRGLRLVLIHGASGVGKSSLLKAGLLYRIVRQQALSDRPHWAYAEFNPGDASGNPFQAMIEACLTHTGTRLQVKRTQLADDLRKASALSIKDAQTELRNLLLRFPMGGDGLILAVNQLEELWGAASALRDEFLTLLAAASATSGYLVLMTLRSDRLADFTSAPQILPILQQQNAILFPLGPPNIEMLEEIIAGPAKVAALKLENGLAHRIAREIHGFLHFDYTALPILAALMRQLWLPAENVEPRLQITHADFDAAGSPTNIIQALVQRIQTGHDKTLLHALFERLVDVRDGKLVPIRSPFDLLVRSDPRLTELVNQLASEARVLQIGDGQGSPVRVAHESLFELWPDLRSWTQFNLDDHALRDELLREARLWRDRGENAPPPRMSNERLHDIDELQKERPEIFDGLEPGERTTLRHYLERCEIVLHRDLLIQAVKGGQVSHAVMCLRKLKDLLRGSEKILLEDHRGSEGGSEAGELKCQFWAAITGDDASRYDDGQSIFDGHQGRKRLDDEASRRLTPIFWAAVAGQLELIKKLVERGANLKAKDGCGGNLLHEAACGGDPATIRYLLEQGINAAEIDEDGNSPILWAINHHQREATDILRPFSTLDFQARDGWNAVTEASRTNDVALLEQLAATGHQVVDYQAQLGITPLHVAAGSDRTATDDVVRWLIERHAPLDALDSNGRTAMHHAAIAGNHSIIDILAVASNDQAGLLLDQRDKFGHTPLHCACFTKHAHAARRLLAHGADPNVVDLAGEIPLTVSLELADLRSIRLLLAATRQTYTPAVACQHLISAIWAGDQRLVSLLLRYAPREALDGSPTGHTPLMIAAHGHQPMLVRMLLEAGADPRIMAGGADVLRYATRDETGETLKAITNWVGSKTELRDWLDKRLRELAVVRSAAVRPLENTLDTETSAALRRRLSPESLREQLSRGVERSEVKTLLVQAINNNATESVDTILELMVPLLHQSDINDAAIIAGGRGNLPIARRLVRAGAEEPWWWRRRKITEERLGFLRFEELPSALAAHEERLQASSDLPNGPKRIRRAILPFLGDRNLFVVECLDYPGRNEVFFLQTGEQSFAHLNWTNAPIYDVIEKCDPILPNLAPDYVRWFFSMVHARLGSFNFVDQVSDIPWTSAKIVETEQRMASLLKPIRPTRRRNDFLLMRGTVLFKNALYVTSVRVALKNDLIFDGEEFGRGVMRLERETLLLEDLPVEVDGPPGIFG
nr:ankyrin repeat domain-containing protein [uncultured Rhodopila sp.]